ncbi:hypothetical protein EUGRSUZ_K02042 [Eucalyptus grandis]|uniref:Uncharacterized protein n=2 Tax=Eucalyptus grandis TaxID=71139 RepID=A0ACC3IV84_EUCGR|nr:hypothetical protein EUGRSUZ_K02042 [Eucalyptus grandis]
MQANHIVLKYYELPCSYCTKKTLLKKTRAERIWSSSCDSSSCNIQIKATQKDSGAQAPTFKLLLQDCIKEQTHSKKRPFAPKPQFLKGNGWHTTRNRKPLGTFEAMPRTHDSLLKDLPGNFGWNQVTQTISNSKNLDSI